MGSIRKRVWRGRDVWFIDYIAADGRRIRQTIGEGEEGRRLARKVLAQREAEARLGILHLPGRQTARFGEYADSWLERVRARVKPKTAELYTIVVERHLRPAFGEARLGSISRGDIEAFLAGKRAATRRGRCGQATPLAPSTVNCILTVLKLIFADAVDHGALADNPAARVKPLRPQGQSEPLRVLTPDEIARLLEVAEEPYRTLYLLVVHTGLRLGEVLALRWRDVDLQAGLLYVRRHVGRLRDGDRYVLREGPPKSRHSYRTLDLPPSVVEALLAHPAGDDPQRDYVFRSRTGGPMDPANLRAAFRRHLALAGLPEVRLHDLRHTHAALLIAANVHPRAIQARLGHGSITVTLGTYGHLMPDATRGVGERVEALLQGKFKANGRGPAWAQELKAASRKG